MDTKTGKSGEELYNERLKRVYDCIELKVPDRVPIIPVMQGFIPYYGGITLEEAMNDYDKAEKAFDKFYNDFDPDLAWDPVLMYPVNAFKTWDLKWMRWPGHKGLGPNTMYQFLENENMTEDEYDELIYDPTCFIATKWIPRSFGNLEAFKYLENLRDSLWLGFFNSFFPFSFKDMQQSLDSLMKGAEQLSGWYDFLAMYSDKLQKKGFPVAWGAFAFAPFDMLGDTLRGTTEVLFDLKDRPEKVLAAVDKLTPIAIESAIRGAAGTGRKFVWIWLHKGIDEFMSDTDYKTFYWPSLKKLIHGLIDAGLTPMLYGEGKLNSRLEIMRDVPKGKVVYHFEYVDMPRAKEVLGDVACISGNVPNSILHYGTVDEVKEYCKYLIDNCAKDGGFMMDTGGLLDDAKPENVKAMFDFTREYGRYL